jgi:tetratricopeptide (TPR) repeat protein
MNVGDSSARFEVPWQGRGVAGLGAVARRVVAVLAEVSGREGWTVPVAVIAALADIPGASGLRQLQHLARCELAESAVGGFRIRADAAGSIEPAVLDAAAWARAGRWCLSALFETAAVLGSATLPDDPPSPVEGLPTLELPGRAAAVEWYSAVYPVLARVVRRLSEDGNVEAVWRLALLMLNVDVVAGPGTAWRGVADLGLAAARRAGDAPAEAMIGEYEGKLLLATGEIDAARALQEEVFGWRSAAGDQTGIVRSLNALGLVEQRAGDLAAAEPLFRKALAAAEGQGFEEFAAYARLNLGAVLAEAGAPGEAEALLTDARRELRESGRTPYEADAARTLAGLYRRRRQLPRALAMATEAVQIAERGGLALYLAAALSELAAVQKAAGEVMEALGHLREARVIYLAVGDEPRAAKLADEITAISAGFSWV